MSARIRRRALVKAAVAATVMAVVPEEALAARTDAVITGVIDAIKAPREISLRTLQGVTVVRFVGAAKYYRDGPATLADFRVGDRVAVALRAAAQVDHARLLEPLFFRTDGNVLNITPSEIVTTGGRVALDAQTVIHPFNNPTVKLSLADLNVGDSVAISRRFDPGTARYLARRIGLKA